MSQIAILRCSSVYASRFNSSVFLYQGTNLSNSVSANWLKFQSASTIVILIVVQTILVIRLWAMYGRSRWILVSMTTFGTLQFIASAIIMGKSLNYAPVTTQPVPGFVVCSTTLPSYFAAYWIPILAFESTLLILMLVKGWQNFRQQNVTVMSGMTVESLGNLLVRDSIINFIVINATYLTNAVVWYWGPELSTLIEAAAPWGVVLPPLMASKLLLNLRDAFYRSSRPRENRSMELSTFHASAHQPEASYSSSGPRTAAARSQSQWAEWERGNSAEW
ncbi:hypothetical protein BJ138DRAFT_1143751 [Hygrophoropsis aurantiaca]|uniref:Uncharacterized protein n=1 Tax=Hygrophoropsis aurantiaca TaxID=72124 RepID=A0ACB8AMS2_9AGAM|nr:hypothetical protein BJ138DRAFT_1143751 [Hygrophoropsis aurantiaca]